MRDRTDIPHSGAAEPSEPRPPYGAVADGNRSPKHPVTLRQRLSFTNRVRIPPSEGILATYQSNVADLGRSLIEGDTAELCRSIVEDTFGPGGSSLLWRSVRAGGDQDQEVPSLIGAAQTLRYSAAVPTSRVCQLNG